MAETLVRPLLVASDAAGHDHVLVADECPDEAEGREDFELHVLGVRHAARLLDDHAEEDVAGVVVGPLLAGCEVRRLVANGVDDLCGRHVFAQSRHEARDSGVALDPRRVVEELLDGHVLRVGKVGNVLRQRIGERDLALLHELKDRDGRVLLRHRPDPEDHVGLDRDVQLEVRHAVALAEECLTVLRHDHRGPRSIRRNHSGNDRVETLGQRSRFRGNRNRRNEKDQK